MEYLNDRALRRRAVRAAQGLEPFDVLLVNATLVDVATSELREADVGLVGALIASVHPRGSRSDAHRVDDLAGRFLAPGFIDTHVHFESSHLTPDGYAAVVVPQGTTTIFYDPHELANILGVDGVRYAIEASRGLPLRFICIAPSSVPSAPGLEMSGADFGGEEMREMLSWPEVAGVAEVMDMKGVLGESPRMVDIVSAGLASGKIIEGHARGLSGGRLQGYMAAGISSDHELTSVDDGLEKLRAGMTLEIRGSHDYVLPDLVAALNTLPHVSSQITICTDDVFPDYLVAHGGVCDVVRRLIRYGMDPVAALRCATLNASYRLQRNDLGLIAAGRRADIVVLTDLREITVEAVYANGLIVAQQGRMRLPVQRPEVRLPIRTVKLAPQPLDAFRVAVPGVRQGEAKVRAIKGARFTSWSELTVTVENGFAIVPPGYSVIFVQHRHGRHAAVPQQAILEDWGEMRGAIATTYSHDAHNLVVIGREPADMQLAANTLIAGGGGMVVVQDGQVLAHVPMPVAGILSTAAPDTLAEQFSALKTASERVAEWQPPYRVFKAIEGTCLACNAGPHLTDLGLTDGSTGKIVSMLLGD